jgi:thiamine kinase-like enzyme
MYPAYVTKGTQEWEELYGARLNKISILQNRTNIFELAGGLTNTNLAIDTPTGRFVARMSSNESSALAIDRESEYRNSFIAAEVGIGAPVHDYLPGEGVLVIGFLEGCTYGPSDVKENLPRIAESLRLLHSAPPFVREFNMIDIQQRYLATVQEKGFRIPESYLSYQPHLARLVAALAVLDEGTVPCNNDLLPGNFIDDGSKIWLIDYEYSGNNDACFELGNVWSEASLSFEYLQPLVDAYYGKHRPEKFARAWLLALLAKYGWMLWASIQDSISTMDFDFWGWGMEKYERAESDFNSPRFEQMLEAVTRPS